jgi:hypothetical protein
LHFYYGCEAHVHFENQYAYQPHTSVARCWMKIKAILTEAGSGKYEIWDYDLRKFFDS